MNIQYSPLQNIGYLPKRRFNLTKELQGYYTQFVKITNNTNYKLEIPNPSFYIN